jgi:phosphomannomutase
MNRVVVAQTALAIARFLKTNRAQYLNPNGGLSVVIGFDGRTNSDIFAKDSAAILQAAGVEALLFDFAVPTPVAAFTGRQLRSSATIVVTASHNPPRDNGYKVYLGGANGGSQLISPQDGQIAAEISAIAKAFTFGQIPQDQSYGSLGQAQVDAYVSRAAALIRSTNPYRSQLSITYTAMHGVGYRIVKQLFDQVGFRFESVARQQEPDGAFPTVAFPNPEEPGAMDLSFEHASIQSSDLIIANDPDADRLAIGLKTASGYQMLTGDQVGLLLAEIVASSKKAGTLANSIVSANISAVAQRHGLGYQQTLTGFKWISKVEGLVYGYEEALGYCVDPSHTPDKDGITAALLIAELASDLKAKGMDLAGHLEELAQYYGHQATGQVSIRVSDLGVITQIMAGVRAAAPERILQEQASFEDLAMGIILPKTDAVVLTTDSYRVIIRPSGTEPKLKCYLQVVAASTEQGQLELESLRGWARDLLASYQ